MCSHLHYSKIFVLDLFFNTIFLKMSLLLDSSPFSLAGCARTVKTTTWFEEHLSDDNQEYMRKSMGEEYRRQTAAKLCPLKDEPWQRHEWTKGVCFVDLF